MDVTTCPSDSLKKFLQELCTLVFYWKVYYVWHIFLHRKRNAHLGRLQFLAWRLVPMSTVLFQVGFPFCFRRQRLQGVMR